MKFLIFLTFLLTLCLEYAYACSGDCITCHPALLNKKGKMDSDHVILQRCKMCHIDGTKIEIIDKNVSEVNRTNIKIIKYDEHNLSANTSHTECGDDCWKCHDITKVSRVNIQEHKVLKKCIACHISVDKNFLKKSLSGTENSLSNLLRGQE